MPPYFIRKTTAPEPPSLSSSLRPLGPLTRVISPAGLEYYPESLDEVPAGWTVEGGSSERLVADQSSRGIAAEDKFDLGEVLVWDWGCWGYSFGADRVDNSTTAPKIQAPTPPASSPEPQPTNSPDTTRAQPVATQTAESRTVESQAVESQTVESQTVETQTSRTQPSRTRITGTTSTKTRAAETNSNVRKVKEAVPPTSASNKRRWVGDDLLRSIRTAQQSSTLSTARKHNTARPKNTAQPSGMSRQGPSSKLGPSSRQGNLPQVGSSSRPDRRPWQGSASLPNFGMIIEPPKLRPVPRSHSLYFTCPKSLRELIPSKWAELDFEGKRPTQLPITPEEVITAVRIGLRIGADAITSVIPPVLHDEWEVEFNSRVAVELYAGRPIDIRNYQLKLEPYCLHYLFRTTHLLDGNNTDSLLAAVEAITRVKDLNFWLGVARVGTAVIGKALLVFEHPVNTPYLSSFLYGLPVCPGGIEVHFLPLDYARPLCETCDSLGHNARTCKKVKPIVVKEPQRHPRLLKDRPWSVPE